MVEYQQYVVLVFILGHIALFYILDTLLSITVEIVVGADIEKHRSYLFLFRIFFAGSDRAG